MDKFPIIYMRGYAGTTSGIDSQVDDPFYGFNKGGTHVRVDGSGDPVFYQFEGPLLRLITDNGYALLVHGNQRQLLNQSGAPLPAASIWVHRFYDNAATTFSAPQQENWFERLEHKGPPGRHGGRVRHRACRSGLVRPDRAGTGADRCAKSAFGGAFHGWAGCSLHDAKGLPHTPPGFGRKRNAKAGGAGDRRQAVHLRYPARWDRHRPDCGEQGNGDVRPGRGRRLLTAEDVRVPDAGRDLR